MTDETPEHGAPEEREEPEVIFDPALGRFVPRGPPKHPRHPSRGYLSACVVVMAVIGGLIWFAYAWNVAVNYLFCFGGRASDGSLISAAVLGASLWLAASVVIVRLRRRLTVIFTGFVTVYILGLVALWYLSPVVWGKTLC